MSGSHDKESEAQAWGERVRAGRPTFGASLDSLKFRLLAAAAGRKQEIAGRYRLGAVLGRGASGVVCQAHDLQLDRRVAVKLVHTRTDREVRRVVREAQLLANVSHPNIVEVFEVGVTDGGSGSPYVVMEFIDGTTLEEWFSAQARDWREVVTVVLQAARGLWAAHQAEIVHRDFKPANVLVGRDGRVRVADFGLARPSYASSDTVSGIELTSGSLALTPTGQTVGTPAYMPRESFLGSSTPASDQYALCCVLYEGLVGERLMQATSMEDLRAALRSDVKVPARANVPRRVAAVLEKGLAHDPGRRHRDVGVLITRLEACLRPPRSVLVASVALAAVALGGLGLAMPPAEERCDSYPEAWNLDTGGSARFFEIAAELGKYEARWHQAHLGLCRGHSTDDDAAAVRCLDRVRADAEALVALLPQLDASDHGLVASSLLSLDAPEQCVDGSVPSLPAEVAAAVAELQPEVSRLRALDATTQVLAGLELSGELLPRVREANYPPMLAEVAYLHARFFELSSRYPEARDAFEEAYFVARDAQIHWRAARAASSLISTHGFHLNDLEAGHRWAAYARAAYEAEGFDPLEQGAYLQGVSRLAAREGDYPQVEALARAQLKLDDARGTSHLGSRNAALGLLGIALYHQERYTEALAVYDEGIVASREYFGEGSLPHAGMIDNRAGVLRLLKRYDEALEGMLDALAIRQLAFPDGDVTVAYSIFNIAQTLAGMGRYDEALGRADAALAMLEARYGDSHPDLIVTYYGRAGMKGAVGAEQRESAIADYERARRIAVDTNARDEDWLAAIDTSIAEMRSQDAKR